MAHDREIRTNGKNGLATGMVSLADDVRFGIRMLWKNRGFAAVALLTLALGIGANTAVFSVVNAVLLRPLPYPAPNQLVVLDEVRVQHGSRTVSWLDFQDWRSENRVFDDMAAYRLVQVSLTGVEEPTLLHSAEVSAPFFQMLGARAALGRTFTKSEDQPGATRTVVLSDAFWHRQFGGDPHALGKALTLDGIPHTVIGTLPPDFKFFEKRADVYTPVGLHGGDPEWNQRGTHPDLLVLARMRPGIDVERARAATNVVMRRLEQSYPQSNAGLGATVVGIYQQRFGAIRPVLLSLFASVGCILLIACVNVANLLLERGSARYRELAIRTALGAGRRRLVRQLLTENIVLSLAGAGVGLALASTALYGLSKTAPPDVPQLAAAKIDPAVLLFTLAVSLLTGVLFGAVPAIQASRVDLGGAFKEGSRGAGVGRAGRMLRSSLLMAEIAVALILVTSAGLVGRSLIKAMDVNPGFQPDRLLAMDLTLPPTKYVRPLEKSDLVIQAIHRLQTLPGVEAAGAAFCAPLAGVCVDNGFMLADHAVASVVDLPTAASNIVTPSYFEATQIPLLEGRRFAESDDGRSRLVAIVNLTFAHRYWTNGSAVGKLIREGGPKGNQPYREIIGVVADVKQTALDAETRPEVYLPVTQFPFAPWDSLQAMTFFVRTKNDLTEASDSAKKEIQAFDKDLLVTAIRPVSRDVATSLSRRTFSTLLFSAFALLALVLGAVGTYGVMAFNVSQRTREIGTRMALGATPRAIWRLLLHETVTLTVTGIVIGIFGTLIATRWIGSLLFGVRTTDLASFSLAALVLATAAILATYVPIRRALRIDPAESLRSE